MGGTGSGWRGPKPADWKAKVHSPAARAARVPRFTTEHIPMPGADIHDRRLLPLNHPKAGGKPHHTPFKRVENLEPPLVTIPVLTKRDNSGVNPRVLELLDTLASYQNDFAGFVRWAFPWGEPGTDLENRPGPEPWQAEQQQRISDKLQAAGDEGCVIEEDVASGHGIGKSAEVAWAVLWAISTHADTKGVVTANTDTQLRTKTWAELAKWYELFIAKKLFTLTATAIYIADDKVREKKWRIDAIPWSKENTEGFAGMHNQGKRIIVIFDEASAIDDKIWEVTEGALTDAQTQILWLRFGNPTKTSGRFFANCLGKNALVLTERGWTPIAQVDAGVRVWDGVEWVTQKGVQLSGIRDTISVFGVNMTPDHLVLTTEGWAHAQGCEGLDRADCRLPDGYEVARIAPPRRAVGSVMRLRSDQGDPERRHQAVASGRAPVFMRVQDPGDDRGEEPNPRDVEEARVRGLSDHAGPVREPEKLKLAQLRRTWHHGVRSVVGILRELLGGHGADLLAWAHAGAATECRGLLARQLRVDHPAEKREQQAEQRHAGNPGRADDGRGRRAALRRWVRDAAAALADVAAGRSLGRLEGVPAGGEEPEGGQALGHPQRADDGAVGGAGVRRQRARAEGATEEGLADRKGPEPVYDLIDCGPRNRFVVWGSDGLPLIVHNCSESGWVTKIGEPPTRNREKKRNTYTQVDSRTVSFSNKKQIQAWVDEYGEDSDFVRVRVKGQFPRAGYANFISPELVFQARRRRIEPQVYQMYPKIMSVDPARFGDDMSVITLRQGLKVHYQVTLSGFDGVDLAGRIFELVRKDGPISCIIYDAIGNGADLDSSLRRMPGLPALIPIQWGVPAKDSKQYFNLRSECWGKCREWLEHGAIPDNDDIADSLTSLDYGFDAQFRIQLQSKKDLKKEGGKSPDHGDSLCLSFAGELVATNRVHAKVRPTTRRTVVWSR